MWGAAAVPLLAAVVPAIIAAAPAAADSTITPTTIHDVTDPSDGELSLREAVAQANTTPGQDTIVLTASQYVIGGTCDYDDTDTDPALVITDPQGLIIDGRSTIRQTGPGGGFCEPRVIRNGPGLLELRGITVTGGHAPLICTLEPLCAPSPTYGLGGGIFSEGPVVLDGVSRVTGNDADSRGGGIAGEGTVELRGHSSVDDNRAGIGGGISAAGTVTVTDSWVQGNRAVFHGNGAYDPPAQGAGGGIHSGSAVVAHGASITDNVAEARENELATGAAVGGGVLASSAILTDTIVRDNEAQDVFDGFDGTIRFGQGGGVRAGSISLTHASLLANRASDGAQLHGSDLDATASVVGGSRGSVSCALDGATTSGGYNVVGGGTCGLGSGIGDRTHVPLPMGSTALRVPRTNGVLSIIPLAACGSDPDVDGDPRPAGGACEAGADEVGGASGPRTTPTTILPSGLGDVPLGLADAVDWAVTHGVMTGSSGAFRPDETVTRGQAIAAIWRMFGSTRTGRAGLPYTDVPRGAAYRPALKWALEADVLDATAGSRFRPKVAVDRATFVTMLWRAGGSLLGRGPRFTDVPSTAPFRIAANWAAWAEVVPSDDHRFRPTQSVSRADAAEILYFAASSPNAWHQVDPQRDVDPPPTNNL